MIVKIELPNNKKELSFILEVLNRLNIRIVSDKEEVSLPKEIIAEHTAILKERRAAMAASDAQFFTYEEAQNILSKRGLEK